MYIQVRKGLIIAVPELPVKRLDTIVPSVEDFVDGSIVLKLQGKRYRDLATLFKYSDIDQVGGRVVNDLSSFDIGIVHTIRMSSTVGNNRYWLAVGEAYDNLFVRTGYSRIR